MDLRHKALNRMKALQTYPCCGQYPLNGKVPRSVIAEPVEGPWAKAYSGLRSHHRNLPQSLQKKALDNSVVHARAKKIKACSSKSPAAALCSGSRIRAIDPWLAWTWASVTTATRFWGSANRILSANPGCLEGLRFRAPFKGLVTVWFTLKPYRP